MTVIINFDIMIIVSYHFNNLLLKIHIFEQRAIQRKFKDRVLIVLKVSKSNLFVEEISL